MRFSNKELAENHARMLERNAFYKKHGYDPDANGAYVISKAIPLRGRVLEIGTGKGRFLSALLRRVPRITTVDVDPAEQRFARMIVAFEKPKGKARYVIADAGRLPWRDRSFDAVISMNALHHIENIRRVLAEIVRVVRPGGKIVLADFNEKGFKTFDHIHDLEHRKHHRERYDIRSLKELLAKHCDSCELFSRDCQNVLVARKAPNPA